MLLEVLTVTAPPRDAQLDSCIEFYISLNLLKSVLVSGSNGAQRPFTFEDYFNDSIRWKAYNLYWISGTPAAPVCRTGHTSCHTSYFYIHIYRQRVSAQRSGRERLSAQCRNKRGVPVPEQFNICEMLLTATLYSQ